MAAFCDRLTVGVVLALALDRLRGRLPDDRRLLLLDEPSHDAPAIALKLAARALGLRVDEADFFAGHLRTPSGEAVRPAARRAAFQLAFDAAVALVGESDLLRDVNVRWRRETVTLHLARRLWPIAERVMLRAMVARALSVETNPTTLILARPVELPPRLLNRWPDGVTVRFAGVARRGWRSGRLAPIAWWIRQRSQSNGAGPQEHAPDDRPALLVLQEDDVSFDRSYRSQPYWLSDGVPAPFTTVILRNGSGTVDASTDDLARHHIDLASDRELTVDRRPASPTCGRLRQDTRRLCRAALFSRDGARSHAAGTIARLTGTAEALAGLVVRRRVRAFLTCENYMLHADAMQLVAEPLGVKTLSYQYSNIPYATLGLATTADTMVTFAPLYHARWTWPGLPSPVCLDAGYPYDAGFALVANRAAERLARLRSAGATFVIGVFDESVQQDKYGLVSQSEYEDQMEALVDRLTADTSLGLVFKTQFRRHLHAPAGRLRALLDRLHATGRAELPAHGTHRNTIFPAEVALSSDITVGFAIGGTASLESALAGARSLIVNPYGLATENDALYRRADILYPTLTAALDAIDGYRQGRPERMQLGDWRNILHEFDPFRDGGAAGRLRAIVTQAVTH